MLVIKTGTEIVGGDTSVIVFEQSSYEVMEDIGLSNFALRVCINFFNVSSERIITVSTQSGSAEGRIFHKMF